MLTTETSRCALLRTPILTHATPGTEGDVFHYQAARSAVFSVATTPGVYVELQTRRDESEEWAPVAVLTGRSACVVRLKPSMRAVVKRLSSGSRNGRASAELLVQTSTDPQP